jgi:hypothetical protein
MSNVLNISCPHIFLPAGAERSFVDTMHTWRHLSCSHISTFPLPAGAERSFVTFILEPLYKLTATVVGEHPKTIERVLGEEFGVYLKSSSYSQDVKPLLKEVGVCGRRGGDGGVDGPMRTNDFEKHFRPCLTAHTSSHCSRRLCALIQECVESNNGWREGSGTYTLVLTARTFVVVSVVRSCRICDFCGMVSTEELFRPSPEG